MIGRKTILSFGINLAKNAAGFVSLFFVGRMMGPEALGIVGFGFAYIGIFNFIADMGFGVAHIKKMSEGRDPATCRGTYMAIRSVLTVGMTVAVLASVYVYKHLFHGSFESAEHETMIYLALGSIVVINFSSVFGVSFAARKETAKQTLPEFLAKVVEAGLKVAVAVLGLGVVMLGGAAVAGAVAGLAAYLLLSRGVRFARPEWKLTKEYLRFALPVMIIVSANALTENLDKVMIQGFWNATELGYYEGGGRFTKLFMMVGTAIGMLVFPTISSMHGRKDLESIRRLTLRAERFVALLLLPLGVLLLFYGELLVTVVLKEQFAPSGAILSVLAWTAIVHICCIPYATQIIGTGREKMSAVLSIVLMVLNVSLNLVLVPRQLGGIPMAGLGSLGAALATLVATCIMALLYRYFARRYTGTPPHRSMLKLLLAAAVMAVLVGALDRWIGGAGFLHACWIGPVSLVAYVGVLAALKEIKREDLDYLWRTVSPWQMKKYVADELGRSGDEGPES